MNDLQTVADEMKAVAEASVASPETMLEALASMSFPEKYRRYVELDGVKYRVQYSIDPLSADKKLKHLSFSRLDDSNSPDDAHIALFQQAFFGESEVMRLPSMWGSRVVQMGQL